MKTIAKHGNKTVKSTNYKPQFAYNSLMKILKGKFEFLKGGKNKNTNSFYIECGQDDYSKNLEIRISDHTKYLAPNEKHELILKNTKTDLQLDIISKENFASAKKLIESFIK